jgi:nucleotide-binding universal stress UspA family protein
MKKILLLTDFSEASFKAIQFAQMLFRGSKCEFTLLHCYLPAPETAYTVQDTVAELARAEVLAWAERIKESDPNPLHSYKAEALAGGVTMVINLLQSKEAHHMAVVGASGAGDSIRMGSVATDLVRSADIHVLVVPASSQSRSLDRIVVATNYENYKSETVFEPVRYLAQRHTAGLTFLTVLEERESLSSVNSERKALLDGYFTGITCLHEYVKDDEVGEGIEAYLDTHPAELLVMISHRKGLLDVLLNRSVTRQMAYEAEVPLLALYQSDEPLFSGPSWQVIF